MGGGEPGTALCDHPGPQWDVGWFRPRPGHARPVTDRATAGDAPEQAAIVRLCSSPLSVAEISAYLGLPVSVVTVLLLDLLAEKRVEARSPVPRAQLPDVALIEAVIHGLEKL